MRGDGVLKGILKDVETQMVVNNLEGFKATVKNNAQQADKILRDLEFIFCGGNPCAQEIKDKFNIIHHRLSSVIRSCEDKA